MSTEDDKEKALAGLVSLLEACKAALVWFEGSTADDATNTTSTPVELLRKDAISLHRLISTSTTRLSVCLGKPPPSYALAHVPLKDLPVQVARLMSCTCSFPRGALRREAIRAAQDTIRGLRGLVEYFEKHCRQGGTNNDEYLARTGVVHDAATKAENLSRDEIEAIARAWKLNGEYLEDSLQEVKKMMEERDAENSGWDELGEEFGRKLNAKEMQRVKQIYPLMRFTTLLHEKILSNHILKASSSEPYTESHLASLMTYSDTLYLANDELASSVYAPQDVESIKEAAQSVHESTQDLNREWGVSEGSVDKVADGSGQSLIWFEKCFAQINSAYNSLDLGE